MTISVTIDAQPLDYLEDRPTGILLASDMWASLGVQPGETVRVSTARGRTVLCSLLEPASDVRQGSARVDRFTRQALKAYPQESVTVELTKPGVLRELTLVAGIRSLEDHSAPLASLARETLVSQGIAVRPGMLVYARLGSRSGGILFEVHGVEVDATSGTSADAGFVTDSTTIWIVESDHAHDGASHHAHTADQTNTGTAFLTTFEDVGGLSQQMQEAREFIQLPLMFPHVYRQLGISPPRGVLFFGAPGTGKTLLARSLATEINAGLFIVNGPEIVGTYSGETESNLRRLFTEASLNPPSIILIDEIDALAPFRRRATGASDARGVAQLLSLMDGLTATEGVLLVGTTNRLEAIDPALRRSGRFDREVHFPSPDEEARAEILRVQTREMPLSDGALVALRDIARDAHGFVGADLMELAREAGLAALRRGAADFLAVPTLGNMPRADDLIVEAEDFRKARQKVRPSALRDARLVTPTVGWDDIGGLVEVKRRLSELLSRALRRSDDGPRPGSGGGMSGIVLHGPPGTGKSLLVEAAARAAGVNLIRIRGPELFSPWLGESEERAREVFDIASRTQPCVVHLDQLDAIVPRRESLGGEGSLTPQRVAHQVLSGIDAAAAKGQVLVIGVTNRLDLVDPAALRPGRLGTHLSVALPDEHERTEILRIHLRGLTVNEGREELIRDLSSRTAGASGARLAEICREAAYAGLRAEAGRAVGPGDAVVTAHLLLQALSDTDPADRAVPPEAASGAAEHADRG
jgi:transitional endoplasmic reticulum ATPase